MKLLPLVFIMLVAIHSAHCADKNDDKKTSLDEQWQQYKIEFERNYDDDEDKMRFKLFVDTIAEINKHNEKFARGLVEVAAGLNEYSDWSDEEKQKLLR